MSRVRRLGKELTKFMLGSEQLRRDRWRMDNGFRCRCMLGLNCGDGCVMVMDCALGKGKLVIWSELKWRLRKF